MQVHSDIFWNKIKMDDYRGRFFIESCYEILHTESPSFHQTKIYNIMSSSKEVIEAIDDYIQDSKNLRNLYNSINELKACLKKDDVISPLIQFFNANLNNLFTAIGNDESKEINKFTIRELLLYLKNILNLESIYQKQLLEKLIYSITSKDVNLKHLNRNLKLISNLSNLYITYLLTKNYSPSYLFHRMQMFTRSNNYGSRNFKEQLYFVLNKLNSRRESFLVYFILYKHIDIDFIKSLMNDKLTIEISYTVDKRFEKEIIDLKDRNTFITIELDSTDYISAAFKANKEINLLLDKLEFHNLLSANNISETCYVLEKTNKTYTTKKVYLNKLLSFVTKINIDIYNEHNLFLEIEKKLEKESIIRFNRSIHYLRMSKDTGSLEQKLLNMWIALESLFDKHENTIIGDIVKWLPLIYSTTSLIRRIEYVLNLLRKYEIKVPKEVKLHYGTKINSFQEMKIDSFVDIFFNEDLCKKIFNNCGNKEFLKYRIMETFEELKTSKKTISRIERSSSDVQRQIRRIYLVRNKLTHQAFHGNVKGQIVNNLNEYLFICYSAIYSTIITIDKGRKVSIDDIFLSYQLGCQNLYNNLKSVDENNYKMSYESITVKALI